jgi:hypothetical protein
MPPVNEMDVNGVFVKSTTPANGGQTASPKNTKNGDFVKK